MGMGMRRADRGEEGEDRAGFGFVLFASWKGITMRFRVREGFESTYGKIMVCIGRFASIPWVSRAVRIMCGSV